MEGESVCDDADDDNEIAVTVGTKLKKEEQKLLWVFKNFPHAAIAILHIPRPFKKINMMGAMVAKSWASEESIKNKIIEDNKVTNELLDAYMSICTKRKVKVRTLIKSKEDVFSGILDLVKQHQIKRLVTDSRFKPNQEVLPPYCQTWFVSNGQLVATRNPISDYAEEQKRHEDQNQEESYSSMQELRSKLRRAEEEARVEKQRALALEQEVARLEAENSEAEREIQALRTPGDCREFPMSELSEATKNFHASRKIGEGGYGPVYLGKLCHTRVAIKILNPKSKQGPPQFQQEVLVLSKVKHPNIVLLMGVCSESSSLIYEHLPNGSLDERLSRKNNTPPLTWQDRVRIIAEQRSALIFLHSSKPHAIVHADLKLANILLDAHNISRLGDFGTAQLIRQDGSDQANLMRQTTPMGTVGYLDPMFLRSGELTPLSDVYSFGIVVLRLLTGLQVLRIAEQVEEALRMRATGMLFDPSAGEWPIVQAEQLLRLALRCCNFEPEQRPGLVSEEWRTLEILNAMAGNQA